MARHEADREDLLREATALVERIELLLVDPETTRPQAAAANVVIGFRPSGAASFYFGADPVYQFNADRELRRAYVGGRLYKAVDGRLVSLQRERDEQGTRLLSQELSDLEQDRFQAALRQRLRSLEESLTTGRHAVVGQVPADADLLGRVRQWLSTRAESLVASSPRA